MRTVWGLLVDLVLVVVFAIIGRASHSEGLTPAGIWSTAWPFLVGALLAWVATWWPLAKRCGGGPALWQGAVVVVVTVVLGNVGRVAAGGTTHWTFIVVTTVTLSILLLGWRLVAMWGLRE